jgi:hypothetical protein
VLGSQEGLALVAFAQGELRTAADIFERGLSETRPGSLVYFLAGVAAVAARGGDRAGAARLWGALEELESELDATPVARTRPLYFEAVGGQDPAGRALTRDEAIALARELLERGEQLVDRERR